MKNHTLFQSKMRLKSYTKGSKMQRETRKFGHFWENCVGCPNGTAPILRVTKNDLLRLKSLGDDNSNPRSSWNNTNEPMSNGNGYHFAVVRTKGKPKDYNGAYMNVAICTPPVNPNQISSARLHIQIGNEFIQAGWTVHPQLYGDNKSRLFVFTNAGGHACYHTTCPSGAGMILVRQDLSPGLSLADKYDDLEISILKDQSNGEWCLFVAGEQIGFWPSNRFKMSSRTKVEWGGAVYSPPPFPSPPMGNGHFPVGNPNKDSYIRKIAIIDGNFKTDNTVVNTERYSDNTHGYKVTDSTKTFWSHTGHLVLYGGPGKL